MTPSSALSVGCLLASALLLSLFVATPAAVAGGLAAKRERAREVATQVTALDARLDAAVADYAAAAQDLAYLQRQIERNRRELDISRFQLRDAQDALGDRAVAIYKSGETSFLDVALASGSFDQLLSELDFFRRVGVNDSEIVTAVEGHRDRVAAQGEQLAADLGKAERLAERRAATQGQIEAALGERQALLGDLRADVARLEKKARERAAALQQAGRQETAAPDLPQGQGAWWPLIKEAAAKNGISARGLYRLMMIESGGVATISGGTYFGLFQYCRSTWQGSWNPWRSSSILDGGAQIRATALAIRIGKGPYWWPNTYGWAFGE